jgi:hypothetical protein
MRRVVLLLGIGCLTALCSGGIWIASRPPIQSLAPPDATGMHMGVGWWEWTLTYRTPEPPNECYFTVIQQLDADGWGRDEWYTGRPSTEPVTYTRIISFDFVVLWDRVELGSDPYIAHIRMRRWITLRW